MGVGVMFQDPSSPLAEAAVCVCVCVFVCVCVCVCVCVSTYIVHALLLFRVLVTTFVY